MKFQPHHYSLFIETTAQKAKLLRKEMNGSTTTFKAPLTSKNQPKIYLVRYNDEIVYVGYTSQSISSRLRYGFTAMGESGYYGYKWREHYNQVELAVIVFEKLLIGNKDVDDIYIRFIEAVEAEIVLKIRSKTGKWPKYQNEIHFNNNDLQEASRIATEIINLVELHVAQNLNYEN
jgi:hypothetical protein